MRQTCVVPPVVAMSQSAGKVASVFSKASVLAVPPALAVWPVVSVAQKLLVVSPAPVRCATKPPAMRVLPPLTVTAPVA